MKARWFALRRGILCFHEWYPLSWLAVFFDPLDWRVGLRVGECPALHIGPFLLVASWEEE